MLENTLSVKHLKGYRLFERNAGHKCRYFCESLFWASQPNQAAKITRQLMPPAAPIRPRHLVSTQQGVETLAPNDFTVFRDALQVFYVSLRKPARRYTYRRLKIFTSLSLRFQDFQRKKGQVTIQA